MQSSTYASDTETGDTEMQSNFPSLASSFHLIICLQPPRALPPLPSSLVSPLSSQDDPRWYFFARFLWRCGLSDEESCQGRPA